MEKHQVIKIILGVLIYSIFTAAMRRIDFFPPQKKEELQIETRQEELEIINEEERREQETVESLEGEEAAWEELDALRTEMGMNLKEDYGISRDRKREESAENYIVLKQEDSEYYIRRPAAREENGYLEYPGAFRFEIPTYWIWGSTDLDNRLEVYYEDSEYYVGEEGIVPGFFWAIEFNDMGVNAFSKDWQQVCEHMEETANLVFGDQLQSLEFEKYTLEDGKDVYHMEGIIESNTGKEWLMTAAYRFDEKNMIEFIGYGDAGDSLDMGNLVLYTAATYEEFEGDRIAEYEGKGRYKGKEIWNYENLHNPFVLIYEMANKEEWKQETVNSVDTSGEVVRLEEAVLSDWLKAGLGIEGRELTAGDLTKIETLMIKETISEDIFMVNDVGVAVDFARIESADNLLKDLLYLTNLKELYLEIGSITDYSPIKEFKQLEVLELLTGNSNADTDFVDEMPGLYTVVIEKSHTQIFVDSLSDDLWEQTCKEQEIVTFTKENYGS